MPKPPRSGGFPRSIPVLAQFSALARSPAVDGKREDLGS